MIASARSVDGEADGAIFASPPEAPPPVLPGPGNPPAAPATPPAGDDTPLEGPGDAPGGVDAGLEPELDCMPTAWTNPGGVAAAQLTPVAPGAGTGRPFAATGGMDEFDYVLEEYYFSGDDPDYTSRLVVKRPRDPSRFSGSVFVEWLNVGSGIDLAVMWAASREYFMREGHVFIGVSAQALGLNGLADYDPDRYGQLSHPGDLAAPAIFSQAGAVVRNQADALLGPCMPVQTLLAMGQSQAAIRLARYINDAHPDDLVYDGYLLLSGLDPATNDPGVPVVSLSTMTDGNGTLGDGPNLVKWAVAGATLTDERITTRGISEVGDAIGISLSECVRPMNEFPSYRTYNAALDWLQRWARDGERPPAANPFEMAGARLMLDTYGNVLGGVRGPDLDVPVATYTLANSSINVFDVADLLTCGLGGRTEHFTETTLLLLYPTHEVYVRAYEDAAADALARGFLLEADHDEAIEQAARAPIPR